MAFVYFTKYSRFKTVAEHLNADGHRTINDCAFTGQAISRILKDQRHLKDGIVSQELWNECQEVIHAKNRSGSTRRVSHLCSGVLRCGCGHIMYVPTNSKKYVCSNCLNKVSKDDMEAIVLENLKLVRSGEIKEACAQWPTLSFSQKREIIESSVSHIIAEGKKVTVSLFAFG